jgi:hypothetical protein
MMLEIQILRVSPSKKTINTCIGRHKKQGGKSSHCLWQGELKRRLTILFSTGRIIFANLPKLGKLKALFFMSAYTSVDCFFGRGYTKDLDFQHHSLQLSKFWKIGKYYPTC